MLVRARGVDEIGRRGLVVSREFNTD